MLKKGKLLVSGEGFLVEDDTYTNQGLELGGLEMEVIVCGNPRFILSSCGG